MFNHEKFIKGLDSGQNIKEYNEMLKNSFLERDCHTHLFNHNNMIENEISCGTNIVKHRFSKHCSKVKEPTHHPRLLPSKHTKQNSGPRAAIQQQQPRPY